MGVSGRLGHGDEETRETPRVIEALTGVKACVVSAGDDHSLVLSEDGMASRLAAVPKACWGMATRRIGTRQ
jgi:hypothetical protein